MKERLLKVMNDYAIYPERIKELLQRKNINRLIVGVSGGADSMSLLHILRKGGFEVKAVHCNFHLRGEESERDMRFVTEFCVTNDVPLEVVDFNVEEYLARHGGSIEMACRVLRYERFREIMGREGADRIAVAHNADDQAETLLLNLMRGSGVAGLRGMKIDTGEIIRPLLKVGRKAILEYLEENGINYISDSSNLSSDYRRNFLRNVVIPLLSTRWSYAKASIQQTTAIMAEEEEMLQWAENQLTGGNINSLRYDNLLKAPNPHWLLGRFGRRLGLNNAMVNEIERCLQTEPLQTGKQWLTNSGVVTLERDRLDFFSTKVKREIKVEVTKYTNDESLRNEIRNSGLDELWTPVVPENISFRFQENSDRITPLGMTGSSMVSKIMKDAKLSYAQKRLTIVAINNETGEIIWVKNLKRSRHFLVSDKNSIVYRYKVNVIESCNNEQENILDIS